MTRRPAVACDGCGRVIAKRAPHAVTDDERVLCGRCTGERDGHARIFPDCLETWHDVGDHVNLIGSLAAVSARYAPP